MAEIPLTELLDEITNDPGGVGYKDAQGEFKPTPEIIALLINGTVVPNPDPAPQIPDPPSEEEIIGAVPQAERKNIDSTILVRIGEHCDAGDVRKLGLLIQICIDKDWFTQQSTVDACRALLDRTKDDPSHPAEVASPSRLMTRWPTIGRVYARQIDACLGR